MNIRKSILSVAVILIATVTLSAQMRTQSIGLQLLKSNIEVSTVHDFLDKAYGANGEFTFKVVREYTDEIGMTHTDYQQYHNGVEMEHCLLIVHSRANQVVSVNGQVATIDQVVSKAKSIVGANEAVNIAKGHLAVKSNVSPKAKKVYTRIVDSEGNEEYRLVYHTRVTSFVDIKDNDVYVDVESGDVVKSINKIQFAGEEVVEQKLPTYYSGEQTIRLTQDSKGYYLSDPERQNYTRLGNPVGDMNIKDIKSDSLLSVYVGELIKNSEPAFDTDGDWDLFKLTWFQIDGWEEMDVLDSTGVVIGKVDQDTVRYNYRIQIRHADDMPIIGTSQWALMDTMPLIQVESDNLMKRDSLYKVSIFHTYYDNSQFRYVDSVLYEFDFYATESGKIAFPDSNLIKGFVEIERRGNHHLDVHYAVDCSYRYYKEVHNRNGFDGNNSPVYQFVDFVDVTGYLGGTLTTNAYAWAAEPYYIATGVGMNTVADKFASVDLLTHEFTHLVVATNGRGGMNTVGEAGAINEAIADCMGVAADFYCHGDKANWQIADGVMLKAPNMRDMSDPKMSGGGGNGSYMCYPQPDTYEGEYWMNPNNMNQDNGGIHYNNGVFNYWYYLLAEGGEGVNDNNANYKVESISLEKVAKLLYRVIMHYLLPTSNYADMYIATTQAAIDLWGLESNEYTQVLNAWHAVGVSKPTGIDTPSEVEQLFVSCLNNNLVVETAEGNMIEVYNSVGQLLVREMAQSDITTIPMNISNNVVIVKVGNLTQKVIVR